ncbi:FAD-dependent oxidoreductase [Parafilimonas sp.]|uniref:FAD-dependent oxidoreductase n=1 Tax=Parafilimonas sp. TaxID=1969739 RepID=UPI0039E6E1C7
MALFLKKIRQSAEIFQVTDTSNMLGAGLNIISNGMLVLKELGLENEIIENGSIVKDGVFKNAKDSRLAKFRFTNLKKYQSPAVNIKRKALHRILLDKLNEENIPIHFNKKLSGIR